MQKIICSNQLYFMLPRKGKIMDKTIDIINEIRNLSTIEDLANVNQMIFNLGRIRGLCENYICSQPEPDEEPIPITCEEPPAPVETCKDDSPFGLRAAEVLTQRGIDVIDTDTKVIKALERRASHMNLKFEISHRWSPSAAKLIIQMLNRKGIMTMIDFVTIFDDPTNFSTLEYPMAASSANREKLNKIFPLKEIGNNDNKKFAELYKVANDNGRESMTDIFTNFINDPNALKTGRTRYANSFMRNGICSINQLYFFLSKYGIKEITKLNGVGHVSEPIIELYSTIKENK